MSDRELLELAAKAEGDIVWKSAYGNGGWSRKGTWDLWNPLIDNDDAFRLAVKLGMLVSIGHFVDVQTHNDDEQKCSGYTTEVAGTDPYASTRRAIVRAAAAIAGQQGKDK